MSTDSLARFTTSGEKAGVGHGHLRRGPYFYVSHPQGWPTLLKTLKAHRTAQRPALPSNAFDKDPMEGFKKNINNYG
ncbi:MAG: hypothetical protein IPO60_08220 [Flavobacteriales bacterium]|nr:hypothetical protein [Flavobacteriales bacterium]